MNAGSIIATLRLNTTEFRQGITEAQGAIRDTSSAFKAVGAASVAAGAVIAAGIGASIKVAANFQAAMSRVGAVSGATNTQMISLTKTAEKLGAETSYSATQAAEGMQYLAMAGFKANEIIAAMPGVLDMAAAGQVELGEAANIASNIMSGFGLEASKAGHVADVLTKAFTSSNTTLSSLGETMKYAAPAASAVGWSLESMAAAAGILGDSGIDASMAGTALRAAVVRLAKPVRKAKDAMEEYNIVTSDSTGKMLPLSQILAQMNGKFSGLTETQRAGAVATIFGTEAMSAMLTLMKDPAAIDTFTKELENAGGIAKTIAEVQLDNLNGALTIMKSGWEGVQIAIGTQFLPVLQTLTEKLGGLLTWFNELAPETQKFIAFTLAGTAAFLLISGVIMILIAMAPMFLGFIGSVVTTFGALGTALTWLTMTPFGLLALAIVGLIAGFVYLWKTNEEFRNKVIAIWNAIVAFMTPVIAAIVGFLREQFDGLVAWWNEIMPQFLTAAKNAWDMIWAVVKPIIDLIVDIIVWAFPYILVIIMAVWDNIKGVIQGALGVIKGIIEVFTYLFTGQWSKLWESIKNLLLSAWQMIWNIFQLWGLGKILKLVAALAMGIVTMFGGMIGSVLGAIGRFVVSILGRFSGLSSSVMGIFGGIKSFIVGVFSGLSGAVIGSLNNLISGIRGKVQAAKDLLGELNPFKRHSPSLVDNVLAGMKVIKDTYAGVSDMEINPPAIGSITPGRIDVAGIVSGSMATANGGSNGATNYNAPLVQVDKMEVRSDEDIRSVSNELYNLQRNAERSRGR